MASFTSFLEPLDPLLAELIHYIDNELIKIEGVSRSTRYGIPFYDFGTWICYLNPVKKVNVEVCFLAGKQLKEVHPELDTRGRKMVAGIMVNKNDDVPISLILNIFQSAIGLHK